MAVRRPRTAGPANAVCRRAQGGQARLRENFPSRRSGPVGLHHPPCPAARKGRPPEDDEWQAIDAEIRRHPAPNDAGSKSLPALLVGKWASPRHEYLFRVDGTWTMLPADEDTTHGRWRIEGNQYFNTVATEPPETAQYTIILITRKDFVFADQERVFFERRIK